MSSLIKVVIIIYLLEASRTSESISCYDHRRESHHGFSSDSMDMLLRCNTCVLHPFVITFVLSKVSRSFIVCLLSEVYQVIMAPYTTTPIVTTFQVTIYCNNVSVILCWAGSDLDPQISLRIWIWPWFADLYPYLSSQIRIRRTTIV